MRNVKKLLLPVLAMGALAFNTATAELTIITVNMADLFDGYYKSEQANQRLASIREQAVAEQQTKQQELQKLADEARAKQEELQNPVLSDESKAEKQDELQAMVENVQQEQARFQQWNQQTAANLRQQEAQIRADIIDEIADVVKEVALKDFSADLVFDTSDIMGSGVPTVLYSDADLDITKKVMLKLNADAPNDVPAQ